MPTEKPDPDAAAGNIAVGLMRLLTMPDTYDQREYGQQELAAGIAEALRYLKGGSEVKLARALDEEVRRQEVNREREKRGLPFLYNPEAERVLREVVGEKSGNART